MTFHRTFLVGTLAAVAALSCPSSAFADCALPGDCFCPQAEGAAVVHARVVAIESGPNPRRTLEVIERLREDEAQPTPDQFQATFTPFTCGIETDVSVGRELLAFIHRKPEQCDEGEPNCVVDPASSPDFKVAALAWGPTFTPDGERTFDLTDLASFNDPWECARAFSDASSDSKSSCEDPYEGCSVGSSHSPRVSSWIVLASLLGLARILFRARVRRA